MLKLTSCLSLLIVSLLLCFPAIAQQQHGFNFVAAFNQAQEKRLEADKKLLNKMEDLADWLVSFRQRNGHFPEPGVEQDKTTSITQAKMLLPCPYTVTGVASAAEKAKPCALRFLSDSTLNLSRIREWQKRAPSDWKAEPGSITVICSDNTLAIWGAGADLMPIFDSKNNKYFVAWRVLD